jgi:hypothetical protein
VFVAWGSENHSLCLFREQFIQSDAGIANDLTQEAGAYDLMKGYGRRWPEMMEKANMVAGGSHLNCSSLLMSSDPETRGRAIN